MNEDEMWLAAWMTWINNSDNYSRKAFDLSWFRSALSSTSDGNIYQSGFCRQARRELLKHPRPYFKGRHHGPAARRV